ncbi:MarR family winged helix-turn-helix transcriptional regulator [Actinocrispum wychmicini]|uniref:DNA-binding MarR family transcriptional regulator n=1 Tax=Actinocrispum wychmicini TaxID=1213861 RepID=A0A4R2JPS8_9PSEU|nr:MarR family transcriptional regulator [Actinocrispum wychmicini]TCO60997.1 DNA-binding MarR family transcriptional regulator [Actinocrispum wychmicini]
MSSKDGLSPEVTSRLGYLLKHAQNQLYELTGAALRPYGISGRELSVLLVLTDGEPASQQQAADRLGIDRTTMVALLDTLEDKGLVSRHPHADDRRRNVVELTDVGQDTLARARQASDEAERRFLAPLEDDAAARQLCDALRTVVLKPHH